MFLPALVLLLAPPQPAPHPGTPEGFGILLGADVAAGLLAPRGWVLDTTSGASQGLHAVMYPEGSSWAEAAATMYFRFGKLQPNQSLPSFIDEDIGQFRKESPGVVSERAEPIQVETSGKAEVRHFSGDRWGNLEAVAYLQHESSVVIYVLTCRSKDAFTQSLPAFHEVVAKSVLMAVKPDAK